MVRTWIYGNQFVLRKMEIVRLIPIDILKLKMTARVGGCAWAIWIDADFCFGHRLA